MHRYPLAGCVSCAEVRRSYVYCPSGSADAIMMLCKAGGDVVAADKDGLTGGW